MSNEALGLTLEEPTLRLYTDTVGGCSPQSSHEIQSPTSDSTNPALHVHPVALVMVCGCELEGQIVQAKVGEELN